LGAGKQKTNHNHTKKENRWLDFVGKQGHKIKFTVQGNSTNKKTSGSLALPDVFCDRYF